MLDLSLYQVSNGRNCNNRLLDLIFVSDRSVCAVSRIDPLVLPEYSFHPTLEMNIDLPIPEQIVLPKAASKPRCFGKTDFNKLNNLIINHD